MIVGVGALGSHVAETLARAGVGRIDLVDRDVVELHNLQRQALYRDADARAGRPKALAAAEHLRAIDGSLAIEGRVAHFDAELWDQLEARPDLVIDGTDNFATRYLINDLALRDGVPWIYGGVVGATGRCAVIVPGRTPCLRCLFPEPPDGFEAGNCETLGVLAPAVATVAALQSMAALQILSGRSSALALGITSFDLWSGSHRRSLADAAPRADCPSCGTRSFPSLGTATSDAVVLCGSTTVQIRPARPRRLDLDRLHATLREVVERSERSPHLLRIWVDGCRISVFEDGRALVSGTADALRARALCDRWIGAS